MYGVDDSRARGVQPARGLEGAVHAMNEIFSSMEDLEDGFGMLLVNAKNALIQHHEPQGSPP